MSLPLLLLPLLLPPAPLLLLPSNISALYVCVQPCGLSEFRTGQQNGLGSLIVLGAESHTMRTEVVALIVVVVRVFAESYATPLGLRRSTSPQLRQEA